MSTGYIAVNGALCECQFGASPDELEVTSQNKEFINDDGGKKLIANTKDIKTPFKAKTFGVCKLQPTPAGYKPCQPIIKEWINFYDKIELENGGNLLTEKSKAICNISGAPCVKIAWHGQTSEVNSSNAKQTDLEVQNQLNPLVNVSELSLNNVDLEAEVEKSVVKGFLWLVHIRSFAPWKKFGLANYEGDDREYSTSLDVTSRISHCFVLDTCNQKVITSGDFKEVKLGTFSSSSYSYLLPYLGRKTGVPSGNVRVKKGTDNVYHIISNYKGAIPIHPGFDIDVHTRITMVDDKENMIVNIILDQYGDRFPVAETFITDTSGKSLFLGVSPARGDFPEVNVGGDNVRLMMMSALYVSYNEKGEFLEVYTHKDLDKKYTVDSWNEFIKKTPIKDEDKKE